MLNKKMIYKAINLYFIFGIVMLILLGISYVCWNGFIDHGEVNMSGVSWLLAEGKPLYTDLDASDRYSLEHGPVIYLITAEVMKILGPSILTAKLPSYIALLLSIVISGIGFYRITNRNRKKTLFLLGLESWILLKWPFVLMGRDDSFMLLCIAAGLLFAKGNNFQSFIGLGMSLGLLVNLKIHGVIYFLPVLALIYEYGGWKRVFSILILSLIVAGIPFLLPEISLGNYLIWLQKASTH